MKITSWNRFLGKEVKLVQNNGDVLIGKLLALNVNIKDPKIIDSIKLELSYNLVIEVNYLNIKTITLNAEDQTKKGLYIFDALEKLDISVDLIIEAASANNYARIYQLLKEHPHITKEEFLQLSGLLETK